MAALAFTPCLQIAGSKVTENLSRESPWLNSERLIPFAVPQRTALFTGVGKRRWREALSRERKSRPAMVKFIYSRGRIPSRIGVVFPIGFLLSPMPVEYGLLLLLEPVKTTWNGRVVRRRVRLQGPIVVDAIGHSLPLDRRGEALGKFERESQRAARPGDRLRVSQV